MTLRRIIRLHLPPAIAFTVLTGVHVGVAWAQDASDAGADAMASADAATDAATDTDGGTADNDVGCGGSDPQSGAIFMGAGCC
ncbi:MAG TPA: hypothetical protein PKD61_12450 [Polyangiaceae bacterium]|nr:hypothetical protein [Polyangiaceae bacterium]